LERSIIVAFDGFKTGEQILDALESLIANKSMADAIAYIKFNDAVHLSGSLADIFKQARECLKNKGQSDIGIMFDPKMADVSGTNMNVLEHYAASLPDILTISGSCSVQTFISIKEKFPTIELALISALTDISEDECQARFGTSPGRKIYNDVENLRSLYKKYTGQADNEPFKFIVTSARELKLLRANLPKTLGYIVPGIRDEWMAPDHQQRIIGVREALNLGATYVVMGAQIMKGNPKRGVGYIESQERTLREIRLSRINLPKESPLDVLTSLNACYVSPVDSAGNFKGPVVGYTATYEDGKGEKKNFVGFNYFNFAIVDRCPSALEFFANCILGEDPVGLNSYCDVLLGAPMGGIQLTTILGNLTEVDTIFAEKDGTDVLIKRYAIKPGERVIVVEDVCNNFSTTSKIKAEIEKYGGKLVGIICAINRSELTEWNGIPVISAYHIPSKEYKQEDPAVASFIQDGNYVAKPKLEWLKLKTAMMNN